MIGEQRNVEDVEKNISLKLCSKSGVGKNVKIDIFDNLFSGTPALECNLMDMLLTTLEIQYIFGGTSSSFNSLSLMVTYVLYMDNSGDLKSIFC